MADTKTLLIVDDDPITCKVFAYHLRQAGFEVFLASNGAEALAILSGVLPDLILLDIQMPVLDGRQFLKHFKAKGWPPVPIIVVTASNVTRKWVEDHGCSGLIRKPVEPDSLPRQIQRCWEECTLFALSI